MRTILLTAALISGSITCCFAQLTFQKTYGGMWADNNECGNRSTGALTTVPGSGYALAHTTQSYGPASSPTRASVYFLRLNSNGDTICTRTYENGGHCYGRSIFNLDKGGFIIGAEMSGTANHAALIRINNSGDTIWTRAFGSQNGFTIGYYGLPLYDGGFAAVGETYNLNNRSGLIGKVNAAGTMVYGYSYRANTSTHGLYFYSSCESYDHGLLSTGYYMTSSNTWSIFIMKSDSMGNVVWAKSYDGNSDQGGYGIMELPDHSIMVTGYRPTGGFGDWDSFVLKTDPNGNVLFQKIYGDSQYQWTNSMALMPNGNIVLCGLQETVNNQSNGLLICIDQAGAVQWSQRYGGYGADLGNSVCMADDGGIVFTGFANSFGAGNTDIYLVKTDPAGRTDCYINPVAVSESTIAVTATARAVTAYANLVCASTNCSSQRGAMVSTLCSTVDIAEHGTGSFSMYPNPASDAITLGGISGKVSVQIVNALGQEVMRIHKIILDADQTFTVDITGLQSGYYTINLIGESQVLSKPLCVSRN